MKKLMWLLSTLILVSSCAFVDTPLVALKTSSKVEVRVVKKEVLYLDGKAVTKILKGVNSDYYDAVYYDEHDSKIICIKLRE